MSDENKMDIANLSLALGDIGKSEKPRQSDDGDDLDTKYESDAKRHRNFRSTLDHWFENVTHPMLLALATIALCVSYLLAKYFGIALGCELLSELSRELLSVLKYWGTALVSAIVTDFVAGRKGKPQDDE